METVTTGALVCKLISWLTLAAGLIGYFDLESKVDESVDSVLTRVKGAWGSAWQFAGSAGASMARMARGRDRPRRRHRRGVEEYSAGELIFSAIWSTIVASAATAFFLPLGIFLWVIVIINYITTLARVVPLAFFSVLLAIIVGALWLVRSGLWAIELIARGTKKKYVSGGILAAGFVMNLLC